MGTALILASAAGAAAQDQNGSATPQEGYLFTLGEIVNVGATDPGLPGIGGAQITREQTWLFGRASLDQAVNIVPGVSSTFDSNGRRNESDVFVRGFGRWQVPMMVDGVRIYLPADNRIDFARFLTADIAAVQVQKGYASVIDGPGAMGGAINLVTVKPSKPFELEGGISGGGRSDFQNSNGYVMAGARREKFYVQGSAAYSDRDAWSLSNGYVPSANSLQPRGERLQSDTSDWRANVKVGLTPAPGNEYTVNYTRQSGEKGGPLNVYNNPPVPANGYWRWPYWDVQNLSFLSQTQLSPTTYIKGKLYRTAFENGLNAYDDITFTTQSLNGRFFSPYDDHAYGAGLELGSTPNAANSLKAAVHYRRDFHSEQNFNRPTSPAFANAEPVQAQSQYTWSLAGENTFHVAPTVDLIAGVSYDKYAITRAEEFNATRGLFEYPHGGSDAFNWQAAGIWRYQSGSDLHVSISDRTRFPVIFELYSTRFGTATPNPNLGPERATNVELGWKGVVASRAKLSGALFYSNVRDLIQTVQLADTTTQYSNVGDGTFYGVELAAETAAWRGLSTGGNYTLVHRTIRDGLQPNLRPTGVPTHKAFLYATWRPVSSFGVTPSLDVAGDRWSDISTTPVPAFPYTRIGSYALLNVDATYTLRRGYEVSAGFRNLNDANYELSWGFPQQGRSFYVRTRLLVF